MHQKEEEEAPLNDDAYRGSDSEDGDPYDYVPTRRPSRWRNYLCRIVGLLAIILVSGLSGAWISFAFLNLDQNCALHTTQWSPLLDDVDIKYEFKTFDGHFMEENIYRQNASAEVDAAWEALGVDYRAGVISYEDGLASGLDDSFVQRNEKYGGGFLVNVEGMHHLHCLNLVRKSLYFNYEHYKEMGTHAFENHDAIFQRHVTHCLDTIRQVLMCNVDTAVLGQVWANKEEPLAFPDFNTRHMCKNYDAVRAWSERLQEVPNKELPVDYLALPKPEHVLPNVP
ncbi:hypothetical protein B0J13DRAFT_93554 [Dactylonectria estremocensis]|uniref:Tat pathway signal sequence n=1 Tax=Dactylonectria estremocensis TaxID=1079267 RepID=A0A9P9E9L7_9HYPO|nr:hypothetical protein B0J13DRAFT_93554 [Dactylonectria estremocensis]